MIEKDDFVIVQNVHRAWINAGWETEEMAQEFIDEYFELRKSNNELLRLIEEQSI